jgi:two-component system chemotaxis response regulator CheB
VLVVLHAHPQRPLLLADALSAPGRMRAAIARDGEPLENARIYVAADGEHMRLDGRTIRVAPDLGESKCCPSIDVLFSSAADHHRERVVGVALVHVEEEGGAGLKQIRQRGGRTITHRNEFMPEAPTDPQTREELAHHHLELAEIGPRIVAYVEGQNGA